MENIKQKRGSVDKIKYRANPKIYLFLIKKMAPITNTRQSPPPPLIIPILKQGLQRSLLEKTKNYEWPN